MSQTVLEAVRERLTEPTSRSLANAVSAAIRDGDLVEGERLPPIRTIARELQVSPTTVSAAWGLLTRAGTLRTDGRRGTTVALRMIGPTRYRRALAGPDAFELDLASGTPDAQLLPDPAPALRAQRSIARRGSYLDDPVLPELLEVVSSDWPFRAEEFTVVDGAMDAMQQIATVSLRFGSTVLVEHPCFPPFVDLLESLGARIVGLRLDEHGIVPDELAAHASGADALFLQPRAHNPTGISMTARRARELANVLTGTDVIVVEDDSAGAIASAPAVSLGKWLGGQTLHVRSYSKSHGPDLRIAVLGGPARLVEPLVERRYLGQGWTSRILQSMLLYFLTDAASVAAVERARERYDDRRERLQRALRRSGVDTVARDGLNLWLPVRDEVAALVRLAGHGIGAAAGNAFLVLPDSPHLRVTAGLVTERHDDVGAELASAAQLGGWISAR